MQSPCQIIGDAVLRGCCRIVGPATFTDIISEAAVTTKGGTIRNSSRGKFSKYIGVGSVDLSVGSRENSSVDRFDLEKALNSVPLLTRDTETVSSRKWFVRSPEVPSLLEGLRRRNQRTVLCIATPQLIPPAYSAFLGLTESIHLTCMELGLGIAFLISSSSSVRLAAEVR